MEDVEKENSEKASILEQKLIQANNDVKVQIKTNCCYYMRQLYAD